MQKTVVISPQNLSLLSPPKVTNGAFGTLQGPPPRLLSAQDGTIKLRAVNPADIDIFWQHSPHHPDAALINNLDHNKYQPFAPPSREWLVSKVQQIEASFSFNPPSQAYWKWMITNQKEEIVGALDFNPMSSGSDTFMVGIQIFPQYQHKGYATKATNTLLNWARGTRQVGAIQGWCHPSNTASSELMKRCGMTQTTQTHPNDFPYLDPPESAAMLEFSIKLS